MKNTILMALVTCLVSLPMLGNYETKNYELYRAVDDLDVYRVQMILEKNPEILTQAEAIRLVDRVNQNRKKHLALFLGGSFLTSGAIGTLAGYISAKTFLRNSSADDRIGGSVGIGMTTGLIALAVSAFFFPANKYRMLITMFSGPLSKEQLKLLGILEDSVTVIHR